MREFRLLVVWSVDQQRRGKIFLFETIKIGDSAALVVSPDQQGIYFKKTVENSVHLLFGQATNNGMGIYRMVRRPTTA